MNIAIILFLVLALTSGTFPLVLGLQSQERKSWLQRLLIGLIFGVVQALMIYLGLLLGQRFMHLLSPHYQIIVFAVFGLIALRMLMEALKIRKENRLFIFETYPKVFIVAVAASINTLIAGMAISGLQLMTDSLPLAFMAAGFVWAIVGQSMVVNRINILFASVSQLVSAFILFVISFLYLFNIQSF